MYFKLKTSWLQFFYTTEHKQLDLWGHRRTFYRRPSDYFTLSVSTTERLRVHLSNDPLERKTCFCL